MQTEEAQKEPFLVAPSNDSGVLDIDDGEKVQQGPDTTNVEDAGARHFGGCSLDEIMVLELLEIFAGTARLTRAVRDLGMAAMLTKTIHVCNQCMWLAMI